MEGPAEVIHSSVETLLAKLLSFRAVVGTDNHAISGWLAEQLSALGARVHFVDGPKGNRRNLLASFGPKSAGGLMLSAHMDVVPAAEPDWATDPFVLTELDGKLYGRGTTDMHGFIAATLSVLSRIDLNTLERPLHLALSHDEEAGCIGAPYLIAALPELIEMPEAVVVGEPTRLTPVLGHKGKAALRITVTGRSGHSARPDQGLNAIHGAAKVVMALAATSEELAKGPFDPGYAPPYSTFQVGTIAGGVAVNVIPGETVLDLEARAIPSADSLTLLEPVILAAKALEDEGYSVQIDELCNYPGSGLDPQHDLAQRLCRLTGKTAETAVSFGTEAGCFAVAGLPAIICGPGDMSRAHRANEYILKSELAEAETYVAALIADMCRNH